MKPIFALLIAAIIIVVSLGIVFLTEGDTMRATVASSTTEESGAAVGGSAGAAAPDTVVETGETKAFSITVKRYAFTPNTITVRRGDRVDLKLKSIDVVHGFSLPDFGIAERLPVGETVEVSFLADRKGTFPFSSQIFSGKGTRALVGDLIVE